MDTPLLGFDRERWERRKAEARAQWERERTKPSRTLKTQSAAYWAIPPKYRLELMQEAAKARVKWEKDNPNWNPAEFQKSLIEQVTEISKQSGETNQ